MGNPNEHQRQSHPAGRIKDAAAKPRLGTVFDPWNSSGTGHQRADHTQYSASTGWRDSRARKLDSQYRAGGTGGARMSNTCGEGSEDYDPVRKVVVPKEVRQRMGRSVADMLVRPGLMKTTPSATEAGTESKGQLELLMEQRRREDEGAAAGKQKKRIFDGLVVYINGSTFPLVSDHKLKQILGENGANMSQHLGRRRVTHVVLGRPVGGGSASRPGGRGGGGLAGGKLEREIKRMGGGCGVKFVGVEWVLESIKAGKRLPEARFSNLKLAAKGQDSVYKTVAKETEGE